MPPLPLDVALPPACLDRLAGLLARGGRTLLGIAGPPGAGKSTLAAAVAREAGGQAVVVPMDGYHLAQVELERLGRAARKGAEDTFDAAGFVALLRRLREQGGEGHVDEIVYAPAFRREIEEPIAGAIPVLPDVPLVVVEGNYLLLDRGAWAPARALFDETWFVEVDPGLRRRRLVDRHIEFGRSPEAAEAWVSSTDDPNAVLIDGTKGRASLVVPYSG